MNTCIKIFFSYTSYFKLRFNKNLFRAGLFFFFEIKKNEFFSERDCLDRKNFFLMKVSLYSVFRRRFPIRSFSNLSKRSVKIEETYETMAKNLNVLSRHFGKPLTLAEKIIYGYLDDPTNKPNSW